MNILSRIRRVDKVLYDRILFLTFFRLFLEAFSTNFLLIITLSNYDEKNNTASLILIGVTVIFCIFDILFSPNMRRKNGSYIKKFLQNFRVGEVSKYIESDIDAPQKFSVDLKIAENYTRDFLNESLSQIGYRLIYGVGSLISVILLDYKFFLILLGLGVSVMLIRFFFTSSIELAEDNKYMMKKRLMINFDFIFRNINYYVNKIAGKNSYDLYKTVNKNDYRAFKKHLSVRGKMMMIISLLSEITLFILWFIFSFEPDNSINKLGIIFAIRPAFNFFNYLSITVTSLKENLRKIKEYFAKGYTEKNTSPKKIPENYEIEFKNVSFEYEENKPVLNDFNYIFKQGGIYEIRGPKGIGKSTMLNLIMDNIEQQKGTVAIGNLNALEVNTNEICFFLPTDVSLFHLDVKENILLGKEPDETRFNSIVSDMNIENIINGKSTTLSTGETKRVALSRAFFTKHKIILLDEFNANLDDNNSDRIYELLKMLNKQNKTIIFINHKERFPGTVVLNLNELYG